MGSFKALRLAERKSNSACASFSLPLLCVILSDRAENSVGGRCSSFFFPNFIFLPIRIQTRGRAFSLRLATASLSHGAISHTTSCDLLSDGRGLVGPSHFEIRLSAVANLCERAELIGMMMR